MKKRILLTLLVLFFISIRLLAHTVNYDFSAISKAEAGWIYFQMGFTHILPYGFDHVLFILGLFFLNPKVKSILWQATAFTIAHSITLGLAIFGFIHPVSSIIEPIIALSILL